MEKEKIKSLKILSYNHLMTDLIENSVKDCSENNLLPILILDNYTSKILSSILKTSDLINKGISSIELINSKRNKYENYAAIYFISPTNLSCDLLIEDFIDLEKPAYKRIYIFFTHKISEDLLESITTEGIIKHTILIKEFNLSFFIFDDNIFDLRWKSGLKIFNCSYEYEYRLLESITHGLFTICSTLDICPYIQYQKNSHLCAQLSDNLQNTFENSNIMKNKMKEGIILLTDRSCDICSPLLHDYNYQSICYDLFDINNKKIQIVDKIFDISENNEFWNKFKYMNIAEVFQELIKSFEKYENNEIIDKGDLNFLEMANFLKKKNESNFIIEMTQLIEQLYLSEIIKEKYKKNYIQELIQLEQEIIEGKLNNEEISSRLKEIKDNPDINKKYYQRLLLILYLTNRSLEMLNNDLFKEESSFFNNIKYIRKKNFFDVKRYENYINNKPLINDKIISKIIKYDKINIQPILSSLVYKASNYILNEDEFPFKAHKKEEIKINLNKRSPLILFNIGGLSYNEISWIKMLEKNGEINHNIYFGSTSIMNASEYINDIRNIDKNCEKEIKNDCLEDYNTKRDEDSCILNVLPNNNINNNLEENIPSEKEKLLGDDLIYI